MTMTYEDWVADGKPVSFARPIARVRDRLRAHGYTVYDLGNQAHLTHYPPEDHTPFSATGWPVASRYPYVHAIDIMPPAAAALSKIDHMPLPTLAELGAQLHDDRAAGHAGATWIKYMNWEPEGNYTGPCYHCSWMPEHARRDSSDRGHIHVSCCSDAVTWTSADDYDPVQRIREEQHVALTNDDARTMWNADIIKAPEGSKEPDGTVNVNWSAASYLYWGYKAQVQARDYAAAALAAVKDAAAQDNVDEQALAVAAAPLIAQAVIAALPVAAETMTREELEQLVQAGVREVFADAAS